MLLVPSTETQLCTTCFCVVLPDRENLCPACLCRDSLISTTSKIAKKLFPCEVVNGNRVVPHKLRATLCAMVTARVMARMKKVGTLQGEIPELHQHRLVGLHTEDSFIYSEISSSSAPAGITDAAVADFMSMAPPVDISAAASSKAEEKEEEAEEEADYGEYSSPIVKADAASSPAATTIGGKRCLPHRHPYPTS
jgi:hypothetical protein